VRAKAKPHLRSLGELNQIDSLRDFFGIARPIFFMVGLTTAACGDQSHRQTADRARVLLA
jgi:hypothetical protein